MENNKVKDLEEDEELAALRLAALLSRKSRAKEQEADSSVAKVSPITSLVTSGNELSRNSPSKSFHNTNDRSHPVYNKSWRKPNPAFKRNGPSSKCNQRSNLIVINPVSSEDKKPLIGNAPLKYRFNYIDNENSMSPKSDRRTGPSRFNRHDSDSSSESDDDIEMDAASNCSSNETVLQDEPSSRYSLSRKSPESFSTDSQEVIIKQEDITSQDSIDLPKKFEPCSSNTAEEDLCIDVLPNNDSSKNLDSYQKHQLAEVTDFKSAVGEKRRISPIRAPDSAAKCLDANSSENSKHTQHMLMEPKRNHQSKHENHSTGTRGENSSPHKPAEPKLQPDAQNESKRYPPNYDLRFEKLGKIHSKTGVRKSRSRSRSSSSSLSDSSELSSSSDSSPVRSIASVIKPVNHTMNKDLVNSREENNKYTNKKSKLSSDSDHSPRKASNFTSANLKISVENDKKPDTHQNTKVRIPVHMRLGTRKRVIQMAGGAPFSNPSSEDDNNDDVQVNKCKKQNLRIITEVYNNSCKPESEKQLNEKSLKRADNFPKENTRRLKLNR